MSSDHRYILNLHSIFINPSTEFSVFQQVYDKLIGLIKEQNGSEWYMNIIEKRYNERLQEAQFDYKVKYLILIWVCICLIGIVSNLYVIIVLLKVRQKIVYEIFCMGLAMTDLSILVFAVPITTLHYGIRRWIFGNIICKLVNFMVYVAVFSSTSMLLVVTITRFMAVVFPWQNRSFTIKMAKFACCIIWIIGVVFSSPVLIYFSTAAETSGQAKLQAASRSVATNHTRSTVPAPAMANPPLYQHLKCQAHFPNDFASICYFISVFILTYLLPFLAIIIMNALIVRRLKMGQRTTKPQAHCRNSRCEGSQPGAAGSAASAVLSSREAIKRQRRSRVTKIIILVTMLYCICWLPTQIINCWYYLDTRTFPKQRAMQYTKFMSQTLSFASACVNPIVYSIMSDTFKQQRHNISHWFIKLCCCCRPQILANQSSDQLHNQHNKTSSPSHMDDDGLVRENLNFQPIPSSHDSI